jgi:hypothetical protein
MKSAELRDPSLPGTDPSLTRTEPVEPARAGIAARRGGPEEPVSRVSYLSRPVIAPPEALFRLNSVVCQVWLVQLHKRTQQRYSQTGGGMRPALQTGYAWRSFSTFFEPLSAIDLVRLFENLLRFASFEAPGPARSFFLAYAPLAFEHDMYGAYIGPGVWTPPAGAQKAAQRVRRTLQRWCDWLEALTHFHVHRDNFQSKESGELDKAIILLWPLLKQHHWTYADLLALLRAWPGAPVSFAADEEFSFYCRNTLGLYCQRLRSHRPHSKLYGQAVAERLLRFLPTVS